MVTKPCNIELDKYKLNIYVPQQKYRLGTVSKKVTGGLKSILRRQPHPQLLTWYNVELGPTFEIKFDQVYCQGVSRAVYHNCAGEPE